MIPSLETVNILAVDDVEENVIALATLLNQPGLRLLEARSGNEALEALLKHDIALALVDVNMPGMDGFELAELMRGSERTKHVPIIFLTATAPERKRMFQGYEAGAVDFLFKPVDPHLLASKVSVFAQLHRQKRQLASQLDQIQQAQRMSDLFVGVLGHDLRNPLNSIVGGAALLELRPGDAEDTRRKARMILSSSRRMERLIQQVLDFALARVKGGIPVEPAPADLEKIARQVVAELGAAAVAQVQTELRGDPRGYWDVDRLMQVVSNLVGNAIEHGGSDSPVSVRIDGSAPDEVWFEVHNSGVIPATTLELLFSPYKPRERHSRGLGLGLYIVDQIVRAHGGSVSVRSEASLGTLLRVGLPRHGSRPEPIG
jgi:two-component system, sensor histidine kinase and response regulator